MFQVLAYTRSATAKAMVVTVEQVVLIHEFHNMLPENLLEELDQVRCERNRSVVDGSSSTLSFVNRCND